VIDYRALRPNTGAPHASLTHRGGDAYLRWFAPHPRSSGRAPELWLFLGQAPKKALEHVDVIEAPGALVVQRSAVADAVAQWVAQGQLRLVPVKIAPVKQPPGPRFDKAALDADFVVLDPVPLFAADRGALPDTWFAASNAPGDALSCSKERALMIDVRTPLSFRRERAPVAHMGRLLHYPLDA
jgi:hypothetical protein